MKLVPRRTGSGIKLPRMLTRLSDSEDRLACAGQCHVDQSVGLLVRIQSASESSMPVIAQSNAIPLAWCTVGPGTSPLCLPRRRSNCSSRRRHLRSLLRREFEALLQRRTLSLTHAGDRAARRSLRHFDCGSPRTEWEHIVGAVPEQIPGCRKNNLRVRPCDQLHRGPHTKALGERLHLVGLKSERRRQGE